MATLINLRQVRKVKAREQRADSAAEQRVRYGRSAAEKQASLAEDRRASVLLDGHRLERDVQTISGSNEPDQLRVES